MLFDEIFDNYAGITLFNVPENENHFFVGFWTIRGDLYSGIEEYMFLEDISNFTPQYWSEIRKYPDYARHNFGSRIANYFSPHLKDEIEHAIDRVFFEKMDGEAVLERFLGRNVNQEFLAETNEFLEEIFQDFRDEKDRPVKEIVREMYLYGY